MTKHSEASLVHVPYNWTYDDATEREAATGFIPADVGKLSRQLDDNSLWMLIDDSPETWIAIGSGGTFDTLVSDRKVLTSGDLTTTSTTFVDVDGTNLVITLTTGARRCRITCIANVKNSAANNTQLDVDLDGGRLGQDYGLSLGGGGANFNFPISFSIDTAVLSAGSHTFKLQWRVDGGTGTIYASTSISPVIFSVVELPLNDPA